MIEQGEQNNKEKTDFPPKQTLYIRNINEKIKPKDVKYILYNLFESFGQILQIIVKRNDKMRGQAFVVFRDVGEATAAKNNLNGYPIFEITVEDFFLLPEEQNRYFRRKAIHKILKQQD